MKYLALSSIILVLYLVASCAQQTSPTGGPQDTIPPVLIQSSPPNKTINFKSKSIELTFDEAVMINNPREQLLITPTIGNKVEMEARKKTVILNFNSELKDSTTYTINFRESIQDVTEKNSARNLQLAFSTGTYLDSLTIKGTILDLLSGKEVKDGTAALYTRPDTFNIFKHKPIYLTRSNDKGYFEFNNLKPGNYYIYAFNDKNKNLIVDSKSERYGFLAKPIELKPDSSYQYIVPIIALDARELKLISARPYNTYFNIRTSKNLSAYNITTLNTEDSLKLEHIYGEDNTSVHLFFHTESQDSIPIKFEAADTIGNVIDTLLYAKLSPRKSTPERFNISLQKPKFLADKNLLQAEITFNKPIKNINLDSIYYQIDSTHIVPLQPQDFTLSIKNTLLINKVIPKDLMPAEEADQNSKNGNEANTLRKSTHQLNKLRLRKGFLISMDNDSSQTSDQIVAVLTPETTGTILVQVNTTEKNYIVQILTQDNSIHQTIYNTANISITHLPPGNYRMRLIIDYNDNKKWDAGNFFKKEEPEPIVYYTDELKELNINIKANWELGPLLISYPEHVDNP